MRTLLITAVWVAVWATPVPAAAAEAAGDPAIAIAVLLIEEAGRRHPDGAGLLRPVADALQRGRMDLETACRLVRLARDLGLLGTPTVRPPSESGETVESGEAPMPAPLSSEDLNNLFRPSPEEATDPDPDRDTVAGAEERAAEGLFATVRMVSGDRVILDKGSRHGVEPQQRFRLERDGNTLVQAVVFLVKEDFCGAALIENTWVPAVEERVVEEGDRAELVE